VAIATCAPKPAATPAEPRARLQQAFAGALAEPAVQARVEQIGNLMAKPEERTEAGFTALLVRERAVARQAVALAKMQPE
jgi:tripartite-type tricarboxylate transporter receptor subunit TctC